MWRRWLLIIWFAGCICIAVNSSLSMFIDFVAKQADNPELARVDSEAVERMRQVWMGPMLSVLALLVVSATALLVQGWRRPRRRIMRHAGVVTDLPPDASTNLDHYLYGHPKE